MLLVEGDDDADTRFGNAIVNPSNPDTKMNTVQVLYMRCILTFIHIKCTRTLTFENFSSSPPTGTRMNTVQDVSHGTTVPGSTHYSKPLQVAPSSLEADRVLRKPVPIPGNYSSNVLYIVTLLVNILGL